MTFQFDTKPGLAEFPLHLTYLIGEPGSGKSSLASFLAGRQPHRESDTPFAHRLYSIGVTELGKRRPDYPGTDALSMSVQPKVVDWLNRRRPFLVFGEGDRLGNASFLKACEEIGYTVHLYALWGPEVAAVHRAIRGSTQPEDWVNGRRSKVRNLMELRPHTVLTAGDPLSKLAGQMLDPVSTAFNRGAMR